MTGSRFLMAAGLAALVGWAAYAPTDSARVVQIGRVGGDTPPPSRYQGNATATVMFSSPQTVALTCAYRGMRLPENATIEACVTQGRMLVVPNPCLRLGDAYARLLCHEVGHKNGWNADHSN